MKIIRFLLLALNGIAVIQLLLTYCTYCFSPHTIWYFEFIALGYPVYLVINIGFIVFWLFTKQKRHALISFIFIALGYNTLFSFIQFGTTKKPTKDTDSFTLITYNVDAFNCKGWKNRPKVQKDVFTYLQQEQADIICFQEFHYDTKESFRLLDSIIKNFNMQHKAMYHFHSIPRRYFYGNIILSRFEIVNQGIFEFQKKGNSGVWADIVIEHDTVRIFNVHLESYRLTPHNISTIEDGVHSQKHHVKEYSSITKKMRNAIKNRYVQTEELIAFFAQTPYKIFLCGDFNAPPYSNTYRNLKKASHTKDAFLSAGHGIGGTLHWNLPSIRLDYVLYPKQWKAVEYRSKKQNLSGHYPISVKICRN
ncbi:MAG: endonuclease/exonuclease/phosphatase family protein [Bacteroidales bacterium]|nr:endonuclease/exonuclease/phosphatase family protein [Bacteroidales bacterium]NLK80880.1 endonuclease/exonuclease/phosphatase family protein [Bacteroidales bacterium]HPY82491.1 endonuclease/exonuclease/phosphatase family protein [Bacteroidales bacterium]